MDIIEFLAGNTSWLVGRVSRFGVGAGNARDVAQEASLAIVMCRGRYDARLGEPAAWAVGVAARQASNFLRRAYHRREHLRPGPELDLLSVSSFNPEEAVIADERRALLSNLLAQLKPERRAVIVAHLLDEQDMEDVARDLDIPLSTAWSRLRLGTVDLFAAGRRYQAAARFMGRVRSSSAR